MNLCGFTELSSTLRRCDFFLCGGDMELLYKGKTKDVYKLDEHQVLLKFKDDMTGKDGVFDPGENQVGLSIKGMGKTNLLVTERVYKMLEAQQIPTHRISADIDKAEMIVTHCAPFGHGLEVIFRNFAAGSFVRRYGLYAREMMPLEDYVEFTLKDDQRQDPLITKDALIALGILKPAQYDTLKAQTVKIARILTDFLAKQGAQLIDIKFEFGTTPDGDIVLMDEISPGSMRVYRDGEKLDPNAIADLFLKD